MEPCAPGTEDDQPIMFSTLTKQENEKDRLLKLTAVLRNGRLGNVFELSYVNGAEHWFCKVCECPVMGRAYQHEQGKRHTANLVFYNKYLNLDVLNKNEEVPPHNETISIAPGEPVPPGFEDEFSRVAQLQERLDGFKVGPLVGLEYLIELQDYDPSKEASYLCILCDKRGDPRTVLIHIASFNHINQYLQKHFPKAYRALAPYMTKQYKRNWQVTLQKIAEGIEKKFGRLKPFPINKDKFEQDRIQYLTMIAKGRHFSELSGYTFEELVVHDELTKSIEEEKSYKSSTNVNWGGATFIEKPFKKRSPSPPVVAMPSKKSKTNSQQTGSVQEANVPTKSSGKQSQKISKNRRESLSSVSSVSSNEKEEESSKKHTGGRVDRFGRNRSPIMRDRSLPYARRMSISPRRRSASRSPSPRRRYSPRRRSPSPRRRNDRDRQGRDNNERRVNEKEEERLRKIEEFTKLARAIENDMQNTLKNHEKNPEKHPCYNEEWKKFWNRRYKELQLQGVDVSKHDFKPEWIQFWNRKMVELHSDELRSKKEALKRRLGLTDEVKPIKFSITPGNPIPMQNLPMAAQPDQDNEVIIINDDKDSMKSRNRSHSPWENDSSPRPKISRRSPNRRRDKSPRYSRTTTRSRSRERYRGRSRSSRSLSREREFTRGQQRQKELSPVPRNRERGYSRHISRSPIRDDTSRGYSPFRDKQLLRERDFDRLDREGSNSKEKRDLERRKMEYRESSFERDRKSRERVRTVADLPWARDKAYRAMCEEYYRPPRVMRDVSWKPEISKEEEEEEEGEINVVDVLRILTALEERLGSLGPKVIDLLAQALAMEKKEANSSENLLDSDINCVLFETIKEKLKGQLLTGLVDMIEERAFKKAIKKIASLVHLSNQRKSQREKLMPKLKSFTVPGVGGIDRNAIAKQIANALVLQGKTDVSQAELEQLINAVVGMAEASKNNSKPMTTANFLQQLSGSILEGNHPATRETGDKIIIPTPVKKNLIDLDTLIEPLTPSPEKSTQNMENLSDSDLKTLLQNFKDLCTEEQHNLINYLKKLEDQEPERVEKLRKFVQLEVPLVINESARKSNANNGPSSPFSGRMGGVNPASNDVEKIESDEEQTLNKEEKENTLSKIHVDSEEEDYTFEDVVKTVSKNVKDKELATNMKIVQESMKFDSAKKTEVDLTNPKDLLSSLMSNINRVNTIEKKDDASGLTAPSTSQPNLLTNTADFAKTFSNINMASLASIVSSVKNLTGGETAEKQPEFQASSQTNSAADQMHFKSNSSFGQPDRYQQFGELTSQARPDEPERPFYGGPGRADMPGRLEDRQFTGGPTRSDERSFGGAPSRIDRPFGAAYSRPDDGPFGDVPSRLDDRSFGRIPGRLDDRLPPRPEDRQFGGPARPDGRSFGGVPPRSDDRGFGRIPQQLDDRGFAGTSSRLDDRSFGGAPSRLDDRPLGGVPPRSDDRSFIDDRPVAGGLGRLDERQFTGGPGWPPVSRTIPAGEKQSLLGPGPGRSYLNRPGPMEDRLPLLGPGRIEENRFGGNGSGRLENRPFDRPGLLDERSFPSRIPERSYPGRTDEGASGQTEDPARSFSGPAVTSIMGRAPLGPNRAALDRDFYPKGPSAFPRAPGPYGNNMQPHPPQFSNVRGQHPNMLDESPRLNSFSDYPRPGGNFNRW